MKANWLPLSAAVALAISSVSASAVDFHGYFRAGMQANTDGGDVICLGNGNLGHVVGRLGDECDTYGELVLSQEVYNKANSKFTINTLVAYGTYENSDDPQYDRQGNSWQGATGNGPWAGQRLSFREAYAKYDTNSGYSIWAGKRFYQRKDIHILDLYYLNNSGNGAGIENIDVGAGNLNFAVTKWANDLDGDTAWRNVYKIDARWNGIPVGALGSLDASVIYGLPFTSDQQKEKYGKNAISDSGALVTLDLNTNINNDSVSVMNHFVVQYGTNGFAYIGQQKGSNHAGDNYTPDINAQGVRVIDWGTFDMGNFGLGYSLIWAHLNSDKDHNGAWTVNRSGWFYSAVLRPEYKWTDFTRTTLELGYAKQKTNGWVANIDPSQGAVVKDPDAYKVTLAQQFTPGKGFWSRPAIRFYVSYLGGKQFAEGWHANYQTHNKDNKHTQVTVGTQVEAWW